MTDNELLEWYKNNSSSKPTDMSQQDYELNMNKAIKLQQDKLLQENYNTQKQTIQTSQRNAEQGASISNEKLMKYLGQNQLASGVAKGQTSTDFIKANNSYMVNRANIAANSAQQQADLLDSYTSNKLSNETNAYNNNIAILDKYRAREIEDKQIAQADELHDLNVYQGNLKNETLQNELEYAKENHNMNKQQWEKEMEYKDKDYEWAEQDRNDASADKKQAEKDLDDTDWLYAGQQRVDALKLKYLDKDGKISEANKEKIAEEIMNKYSNKFYSEKYYLWLLDYLETELDITIKNYTQNQNIVASEQEAKGDTGKSPVGSKAGHSGGGTGGGGFGAR